MEPFKKTFKINAAEYSKIYSHTYFEKSVLKLITWLLNKRYKAQKTMETFTVPSFDYSERQYFFKGSFQL